MGKTTDLNQIEPVREYLSRIKAEPRSLRTAIVRETRGKYWEDIAVIRFGKGGEIESTSISHSPTDAERDAIKKAWAECDFPVMTYLSRITNPPAMIRDADKEDVFEFRTPDGSQIIMIQVRQARIGPDGELDKGYVPWTYYDDGEWRIAEPDGKLPMWGMDQLKNHKTVFIHEGARGARLCRWMAEGKTPEARAARNSHPWGQEIVGAAHLGWIGGALNPRRTDWEILAKSGVERAYIVADNDEAGKAAIPAIAKEINIAAFAIEFNGRFKQGFDLGDEFPEEMFKTIAEGRFYIGPAMRDLMAPATWATDLVPNPSGKGRPVAVLRSSFRRMWAYVEEADAFVCTEMPEIVRSESVANKMVAGFSHVQETMKLLTKSYKGRSAKICYRPDHDARLVDYRGTNAINLHTPSLIKPAKGSPKPWNEFLQYMFPVDRERKGVERWCATLIAKPEIRMGYGMLLVSETQGIGKTTLGANILAPLVGHNNVGFPSESDITSDFNDWVAHKRLSVVNEIYSGASWKAYHALKSIITDSSVTVNQKYMRTYIIDNWCHILACSNSMRALKMENDDRRWFYPEITETPWPPEKFTEFRNWIQSGGLKIIRQWAEDYGDYVLPSERAPMTDRKREMIEGSRSEGQTAVAALAEQLKDFEEPAGLLMKEIIGWASTQIQQSSKIFDSDYELRRAMKDCGVKVWPERIKVNGWVQHIIMNDDLFLKATQEKTRLGVDDPELAPDEKAPLKKELNAIIKEFLKKPSDLSEREM